MLYCWFFCTHQRGGSVFLSWHLSFFLFVLLIVSLAGISSPLCSKSFKYFLSPVISHFICPSCLRKKYVSVDINLGVWPRLTESLLTNAIENLPCINDCGSSSCLAIRTEPMRASQNDWKHDNHECSIRR